MRLLKQLSNATLVIVFVFMAIIALSPKAYAHRSGCHRWHSCPSDTGSYICGDMGYYSECPTSNLQTPDYTQQGEDNGHARATQDTEAIKSSARTAADSAGYNAGKNGDNSDPSPDGSSICNKSFTWNTPQPQEYTDAYESTFSDDCTTTYNDTYKASYEEGFQRGKSEVSQQASPETQNNIETTPANTKKTNWTPWIVITTIGSLVGIHMARKK